MIRIATAIALVLLPTTALAQQTRETFKDANGRAVGRSVSDGRNTTFYDSSGSANREVRHQWRHDDVL